MPCPQGRGEGEECKGRTARKNHGCSRPKSVISAPLPFFLVMEVGAGVDHSAASGVGSPHHASCSLLDFNRPGGLWGSREEGNREGGGEGAGAPWLDACLASESWLYPRSGGKCSICFGVGRRVSGSFGDEFAMDCWSCFQKARRCTEPPALSRLAALPVSVDPSKLKLEFGLLDTGRGMFSVLRSHGTRWRFSCSWVLLLGSHLRSAHSGPFTSINGGGFIGPRQTLSTLYDIFLSGVREERFNSAS